LVAVCWPLNWTIPGIRTSWLFFPLWLGYILVVDALVWLRAGNSLWSRSRKSFIQLFCFSAPIWWLFELINLRTANWQYLGRELFSPLEFNLLSTIAFSTVIPAVFETAELIQTFRWMHFRGPHVAATRRLFVVLFVAGLPPKRPDPADERRDQHGIGVGRQRCGCWLQLFTPENSQKTERRRLAYRPFAGIGRADLRLLLGDVELLLVSEMGLSHPGHGVFAHFRDALARLWRLHPIRSGTLRVKEFLLADRTAAPLRALHGKRSTGAA